MVKVEVDPDLLHAGADMTGDAGRLVGGGAERLAQAPLATGMFGDFDAPHAFHAQVSIGHAYAVDALHSHQTVLTDVGDKAHAAARAFVRTDDANARVIDALSEVDL